MGGRARKIEYYQLNSLKLFPVDISLLIKNVWTKMRKVRESFIHICHCYLADIVRKYKMFLTWIETLVFYSKAIKKSYIILVSKYYDF